MNHQRVAGARQSRPPARRALMFHRASPGVAGVVNVGTAQRLPLALQRGEKCDLLPTDQNNSQARSGPGRGWL